MHITTTILIVFDHHTQVNRNQFKYLGLFYLHCINCRIFSQKTNYSCRYSHYNIHTTRQILHNHGATVRPSTTQNVTDAMYLPRDKTIIVKIKLRKICSIVIVTFLVFIKSEKKLTFRVIVVFLDVTKRRSQYVLENIQFE